MHPKHPLSSPQHAPGGGPTQRYNPQTHAAATLKCTRRRSQNARSTHDTVGRSGRCSIHPARVSETKLIFCQHPHTRQQEAHPSEHTRHRSTRGFESHRRRFFTPHAWVRSPEVDVFSLFFQTLAPFLNPLFLLFYPILQPSQIAKNNSPTTDRKTTSVQKGYTLYHTHSQLRFRAPRGNPVTGLVYCFETLDS